MEIHLCAFSGVEDGQTVRMSVGNKQVYITFRVSCSAARLLTLYNQHNLLFVSVYAEVFFD